MFSSNELNKYACDFCTAQFKEHRIPGLFKSHTCLDSSLESRDYGLLKVILPPAAHLNVLKMPSKQKIPPWLPVFHKWVPNGSMVARKSEKCIQLFFCINGSINLAINHVSNDFRKLKIPRHPTIISFMFLVII